MKLIAINRSPNKNEKNIAWLLKMKEATQGLIELPQGEKRVATTFIR